MTLLKVAAAVVLIPTTIGIAVDSGAVDALFGGLDGLPPCNSKAAKTQLDRVMADAPMGHLLGLRVVKYKSIRTESSTSKKVVCHADVLLNNSWTKAITYSFAEEDHQIMVHLQFDELLGLR